MFNYAQPQSNNNKFKTVRSGKKYLDANRFLFILTLPNICPEKQDQFNNWLKDSFPRIFDSKDFDLTLCVVFNALHKSKLKEELVCPHVFLNQLVKSEDRHKSVLWLIEDACRCLKTSYNEYRYVDGLARSIQIDSEKADKLFTEWLSFRCNKCDCKNKKMKIDTNLNKLTKEVSKHIEQHEPFPEMKKIIAHLNSNWNRIPDIFWHRLDELVKSKTDPYDLYVYNLIKQVPQLYDRRGENYRVFTRNTLGFQNLKSVDRSFLFREEDGFYELDLKHAHLSLSQFLFKSDKLKEMLLEGDIWNKLLDLTKTSKDILKIYIYTTLYGGGSLRRAVGIMPESTLKNVLLKELDILNKKRSDNASNTEISAIENYIKNSIPKEFIDLEKKWSEIPIIKEMRKGRNKCLKEIKDNKGMTDAFGRFISLENCDNKGSTVLAAVASSYEKLLLLPIYENAIKTNRYRILFDQHDGATLIGLVDKNELISLVDKKAKELNIITTLEFKGE